jgi:hypothetical protein
MRSTASDQASHTRRPWVVLLYFYLAALVGLGFLITGVTNALFGAKDLAFPELGVHSYSYESGLRRDPQGTIIATDPERAAARQRAIDDARREGLDQLVDGVILMVVGAPTLLLHLRGGRRITQRPDPTPTPPRESTSSAP